MRDATVTPIHGRIRNATGHELCATCDDSALVSIGTETRPRLTGSGTFDVELFGPCPFCELGFRLEFGIGTRDGKDYESPHPPWGREGYWRGRDLPEGLRATG